MQTTLLTLGIALILALVSALVGPLFVDWGRFRTDFEARASRMAAQPVRISGDIDVRLLPTPIIRVQDVKVGLSDAPSTLSARGLDAELSLTALMRGEWRVTVLRIDGPRVTVARDPAGGLSGPVFAPSDVTIDRVVISDGRLSLADASSGAQAVLDRLSFSGEVRAVGPIRGEGTFVADGQSFSYRLATSRGVSEGMKLRLAVDPSDRPLTIETEGTLTFENDVPRYDGTLALARPAGLMLPNGKTVASDPWRIDSRLKIDAAVALFEQVDVQYGPDERALRLAGTAELKFGAKARLNAVLSARQIDLDRALAATDAAGRLPVASLRKWAENLGDILRPPLPLTLGIGIDGVTLGGATLQSVRADLSADGNATVVDTLEFRAPGFTQVALSGRVDGPSREFVGPVAFDTPDPKTLLAWVGGVELVNRSIGAFRMRGEVALGPQRVALDRVKGEYDRKAFEGRLSYRFATVNEPARLDVGLAAAEFDLDNAISLATAVGAGAGGNGTAFERPGEIAIAADIGRVTFAGVEAKAAKANITFDRSGLRVDALSLADFGGAAISASGQIDALSGPPRGTVALSLDVQRIDGVAALAASASPKAAELLRANATRIIPAKLEAVLKVNPAPAATKSLGKLKVEGKMGGVRISIAADGLGDLAAPAQADMHIDGQLVSDDGALLEALGLAGLASDKKAASLAWTASGPAGGDLKVDVKLAADGLDGSVVGTLRVPDIDDVNGTAAVALTATNVRWLQSEVPFPVALKTRIAINGKDISFSGLVGKAAGANLRGQGSITLGQPMRIDANLAADQIDLPGVVATAIGMRASNAANAAWSALPFRPLPQFTGRIELDAEQAALAPALVARKLHGTLSVRPQEVTFENVTAAIGGGALSVDASFRSGPGGLSARGRMSLANADATAVIRGGGQPPVVGRLSSKFEVEGAGTNPAALVGSLSGSGSVTLESVQIVGLDPKAIEVAVRAFERGTPIAPARIGDIVGRVMDAGSLTMPWVSVPLAISAGRVRVGKLVAPPQSNDLAMSGALDLVDATIDARFTVFGAAEAAQRPEASILLKGPFAAPRRTVDVSALVSWLTMRSVDREAKRLEAAERAAKQIDGTTRQIDGETALPGTGQAGAVQGGTSGATTTGANLSAPPAQPQLAPALPPPVTLARPPGAILPRPMPRAVPAAPLLLTPQ